MLFAQKEFLVQHYKVQIRNRFGVNLVRRGLHITKASRRITEHVLVKIHFSVGNSFLEVSACFEIT